MDSGQRSWRGTTFGGRSDDYQITEEFGLDDLLVRSASPPLPRYHGSIAGDHTADQKQIILSLWWHADTRAQSEDLARAARALFQPSRITQEAYGFQHASGVEGQVLARVLRRGQPRSQDTEAVGLYRMTVEFEVTDPAIYESSLNSQSLGVFAPAEGLSYPVLYPKVYGAAGSGAGTTVTNSGEWETWPTFYINGPTSGNLTNPILENVTTGKKLEFTANGGVSIASGQQLIIKTHPKDRSVLFATGASRYGRLSSASEWFPLEPGANELRFRASGSTAGANAVVEHRSAWI